MISVEHVTKHYGDKVGVEDITFRVEEGEILGFLGPNGAGKTTTMRVITGYHPPTSGTATVAGYDILEKPIEAKRHIGYLPENPPVYVDMTVEAYLNWVAEVKDVPRKARRSEREEIVEMLGLTTVYKRLIRNLSKGFRQRVGLAQALTGRPEVLILDEPTVGLDPKQIHEIREVIRGLGGRHTVILSSHILPEVSMIAGRVAIINNGRLVAIDTPESLSSNLGPSARVVARIDGERKRVAEAVGTIDGVLAVRSTELPEGPPQFEIETERGKDVRRDLFFKLADLGTPILELRRVEMSLEDVFLKLTTEENAFGPGFEAAPRPGEQEEKEREVVPGA